MKLSVRSFLVLGSVGLSMLTVAGGVFAAEPANLAGVKAPNLDGKQKAPQAHGLVQLVDEALSDVNLKPEQRDAIQKLGAEVEPVQVAADKAENDLLLALADQLAAGKIDRQALAPQIEAFADARQKASPVFHHAFDRLHETLDPAQRSQFVDSLERRTKQVAEASGSNARVDEWAKLIGLSDEQKQRIRTELDGQSSDLKDDRAKAKEIFEAFRGDSFSTEKFMPERDASTRATDKANRVVAMTETIAGILTPEQRTKAAARLRDVAGNRAAGPMEKGPAIAPPAKEPGAREPAIMKSDEPTTESEDGSDAEGDVGSTSEGVWGARGGFVAGGTRRGGFVAGGRRGFVAGGTRGGFVAGGTRSFGASSVGYGYARGVGFPAARGLGYGW